MNLFKLIRTNNIPELKRVIPLLEYKELIIQHEFDGATPLHNACIYSIEAVKLLLSRLAHKDLIIQNYDGNTPLHYAYNYSEKAVGLLLPRLEYKDLIIQHGVPIIDYPKYNKLMKSIKWTKKEHLNYPKKVKTNAILTYMIKSLFTTSCKV